MSQFNTARVGLNTANPFLPHRDHRFLSRGRKNFSYRGHLVDQLPGRKSTHPRLLDRTFLSPVKVTVFYKLAVSAALLDQSLLTILAHTIQKSNYFYQTKWCWAPTSLSTFILFLRSAALHKRYPISELLKSLSVRRSRPTTDGNPPLQDTK